VFGALGPALSHAGHRISLVQFQSASTAAVSVSIGRNAEHVTNGIDMLGRILGRWRASGKYIVQEGHDEPRISTLDGRIGAKHLAAAGVREDP
jgi:hypothetical protein